MDAQRILDLIVKTGALKNTPRAGWRIRGIKGGESVADHAFRMAYVAMILADAVRESGVELDTEKILRMALLHDIGESEIGDIPMTAAPFVPPELKQDSESRAVAGLLSGLGSVGARYREIWEEFAAATTPEARLVRAADKLEMLVQAFEYETTGYRSLEDFWENSANRSFFDDFLVVKEISRLLVEKRMNLRKDR